MKNLFFSPTSIIFLLYLSLAGIFLQPTATADEAASTLNSFSLSGKMEMSGMYCGGANPPEVILQKCRAKKPLVNYKLYIREGATNHLNAPIIDSVETDEEGRFEFQLPPGVYVLLSADQLDRALIRKCLHDEFIYITDFDCLEDWWQKGLAQVTIHDRPLEDLYFHLRKYCSLPLGVPCLRYDGPKPP